MKSVCRQILHQTRLGNHAAHPNQEMLHLILIAPVENRLVLIVRPPYLVSLSAYIFEKYMQINGMASCFSAYKTL